MEKLSESVAVAKLMRSEMQQGRFNDVNEIGTSKKKAKKTKKKKDKTRALF